MEEYRERKRHGQGVKQVGRQGGRGPLEKWNFAGPDFTNRDWVIPSTGSESGDGGDS
jgi:hypothetical protein